jgi:hypothetical protein
MDAEQFHENNNASLDEDRKKNESLEGGNDNNSNAAPAAVVPQTVGSSDQQPNTAEVLILQWLSYAFWGWLTGALIWLINIATSAALSNNVITNTLLLCTLVAVAIMLPAAFITDLYYRKHEAPKKTGAAAVILTIHAVIYTLIAISALNMAISTGIDMLINGAGGNNSQEGIIATIATIFLYGTLSVRIIGVAKFKRIGKIYAYTMLALSIGIALASAIGTLAKLMLA